MKNSISQNILRVLDGALKDESVRANLDSISRKVELKLSACYYDKLAWESVPLSLYTVELPEIIQSSWVFVIRACSNSGAERHPNSHQYMMSYSGRGDLQVRKGNEWLSNNLISDPEETLDKRWVSIPPITWHRVVTNVANWTVVSFHTVPADELIEERPDTIYNDSVHQRYYLNQSNKKTD